MSHTQSQLHSEGAMVDNKVPVTYTTAGAITMTAADLLAGLVLRDPNGAGRADLVPTAAAIIDALTINGHPPAVGASFEFTIRNTADAAETITVTTNTGITLSGTMTIAQSNSKRFLVVVASLSAVSIYSLGTVVH